MISRTVLQRISFGANRRPLETRARVAQSLSHNVARKRTNGRSETALAPVPKRCTNTHPILRVSFGLCYRRITLRDLSTIRTVTRPVIWREQANARFHPRLGPVMWVPVGLWTIRQCR